MQQRRRLARDDRDTGWRCRRREQVDVGSGEAAGDELADDEREAGRHRATEPSCPRLLDRHIAGAETMEMNPPLPPANANRSGCRRSRPRPVLLYATTLSIAANAMSALPSSTDVTRKPDVGVNGLDVQALRLEEAVALCRPYRRVPAAVEREHPQRRQRRRWRLRVRRHAASANART
jgi:hypothetical protein